MIDLRYLWLIVFLIFALSFSLGGAISYLYWR